MPSTLTSAPLSTAKASATPAGEKSDQLQNDHDKEQQNPSNLIVQAKLTIGAPDDPLERQADDVADRVMRATAENFAQCKCSECEKEDKLQKKPAKEQKLKRETRTAFIQKKCAECEKEDTIQKKAGINPGTPNVEAKSQGGSFLDDKLSADIQNSRGSGTGMDGGTRSFMEARMGADFSAVKIHNGHQAVQLNRKLNAQAFATGNDIFFNEGKYQPDTQEGKRLLAHELTHVIQQGGGSQDGAVQPKLSQNTSTLKDATFTNSLTSQSISADLKEDKHDLRKIENSNSLQQAPPTDDPPNKNGNLFGKASQGTIYLKRENSAVAPVNKSQVSPPGNTSPVVISKQQPQSGPVPQSTVAPSAQTQSPLSNKPAAGKAPATDAALSGNPPKSPLSGGKGADNTAVQRPAIAATANPGDLLVTLQSTPVTQLPAVYNQSKGVAAQSMQMQKADAVKLVPVIDEATGSPYGEAGSGKAKHIATKANAAVKNTFEAKAGWQPPLVEETVMPAPAPFVPSRLASRFGTDEDSPNIAGAAQAELNNVVLDTSDLPETIENAPQLQLDGDAGLDNITTEQQEQAGDVAKAKADAAKEIYNDFGENNVIPRPGHAPIKAKHAIKRPAGVNSAAISSGSNLSEDLAARFDSSLAGQATQQIGEQTQQYQQEEIKYQQQLADEKINTDSKIDDETRKSKTTQNNAQITAQSQVNASRLEWQKQLNDTETDFTDKANKSAVEHVGKIEKESAKGNDAAKQHYDDANKEAAEKTAAARKDAEDEKKKSEEDSGGFFGWLADAASAVIDGLKKAVNFIFDKLRAALKWVFDKAKKLAMAALELARKAVVGLIKGFGVILKGFVSIAFAAFPSIRDEINGKIDSAVSTAVKITNDAFERFKKIVSDIIDAFAGFIDKVLAVVQEALNIALSVIEVIVVGFLKIMDFLTSIEKQYKLFKAMIDGFMLIWDHPEILEEKAKEFLEPYIKNIPDSTEGQVKKALAVAGLATAKHITGIMKYLTPNINHLIANWWTEAKKMVWFLIWPFAEGSPLYEDAPKLWRLIPQMWHDLWDGNFSKVIDGGLEWMQALNMTVGAFAGWIAIGGAIIGAILGGIFGVGAGAIPGAGAGFEAGVAIGEGIMVSMIATESAVILKSVYDLAETEDDGKESEPPPPPTKEKNAAETHAAEAANNEEQGPRQYTSGEVKTGRDRILYAYQRIANSGLTLGIMVALLLLGAIGGKIAQGLLAGLKKLGTVVSKLLPEVAEGFKGAVGALKESKFGQGVAKTAKSFGEGRSAMKEKIGAVKQKFGLGEEPNAPKEKVAENTAAEPTQAEVDTPAKPESETPKSKSESEPKAETNTDSPAADQKKGEDFAKDAQNDKNVASEGKTKDGHKLKADKEGHVVECTECRVYEVSHREMLDENPELAKELREIRKRMAKNPEDPAVMKDLEAFDEKVKKIEYDNFSEGGKKARDMGLPDAEPGYHWRLNGENEPTYVKNSSTKGPQRVYDPETKSFKNFDGKAPREIDIPAEYEKVPGTEQDKVTKFDRNSINKENADALDKLKQERDAKLEKRNDFEKGTDEYNKANKEVVDVSEKLGEKAADAVMEEMFGAEPDYTGNGSRTLDKVYTEYFYIDDATGEVKVVEKVKVVEAKGGSADVGSKKVAGGEIAEQGTEPYLRETLEEMKERGGKDAEIAKKVEQALDSGNLEYYKVTQKIDPSGNLKPIEVKKFVID
ncbi:MAG: DUF4157 domain-containing protein [Mucilaginibacter sp.]|nr:DUF4157 domain-containing protein [Mucilaginibacter sp.]